MLSQVEAFLGFFSRITVGAGPRCAPSTPRKTPPSRTRASDRSACRPRFAVDHDHFVLGLVQLQHRLHGGRDILVVPAPAGNRRLEARVIGNYFSCAGTKSMTIAERPGAYRPLGNPRDERGHPSDDRAERLADNVGLCQPVVLRGV